MSKIMEVYLLYVLLALFVLIIPISMVIIGGRAVVKEWQINRRLTWSSDSSMFLYGLIVLIICVCLIF